MPGNRRPEAPRTSQRECKTARPRSGDFRGGAGTGAEDEARPDGSAGGDRSGGEATRLAFAEGCEREAELFHECLYSTQSKALIHAFFGERAVAKIPGMAEDTPVLEIRRAAVIGAGTMGGGIAMNYANAGIPVIVKETSQEALDRGMATIRKNYASTVKKGRLSQAAMDSAWR